MYKSAIGFVISDVLMILVIILNNVGPGWEVPADTMLTITRISFLLIFSFIFSLITLIIGIKKIKNYSVAFRILYFIIMLATVSFLIFLFVINGFQGQFWVSAFPSTLFSIISISTVLLLFIALTISRVRR